jgi:hypothetical protein
MRQEVWVKDIGRALPVGNALPRALPMCQALKHILGMQPDVCTRA